MILSKDNRLPIIFSFIFSLITLIGFIFAAAPGVLAADKISWQWVGNGMASDVAIGANGKVWTLAQKSNKYGFPMRRWDGKWVTTKYEGYFIDVDTQAGTVVGIQMSIGQYGVARECLQFLLTEVVFFLDAKRGGGHIQMHRRCLIDWIVVAALLPRRLNTKPLAQGRDLAAGRDAACLGDADPHVVDETLCDQRDVFLRIDEEFAHRLGRRALLLDLPEPVDLFGRQDIFEKVEPIGFQQFRQGNGIVGSQVLVHIVCEFGAKSKLVS